MNPAYIALLVLEGLLGVLLVVLILLHSPKGEGMGGIGGTATLFTGKRGAEAGLDRLTWGIAFSFLLVCLVLGFGFIKP
ncbi:MAG: preprotein translocase subunit SecG [Candidatus Obscuribacterales bacterium]|nr:preprotein translocase subunit SecG [Candidatus Obscuribacterales bacterium]